MALARYPAKLRERLKAQAPPVLFGAGARNHFNRDGLAVVGSRDVDDSGADFARTLGEQTARSKLTLISGAARGVDRIAMDAALQHGGNSIGVLAESLEELLKRKDVRVPVLDGALTLITPSHPSARFTVGAAMGRNKLIYALSSWAAVVSSGFESGGTWAGALENLGAGWVPLFVRADSDIPEGNRRLLQRGALPLTFGAVNKDLTSTLNTRPGPVLPINGSVENEHADDGLKSELSRDSQDAFLIVWPAMASYLTQPRTEPELESAFSIERAQAKAWLRRALSEGRVEKLKKPVRYIARLGQGDPTGQSIPQDKLF